MSDTGSHIALARKYDSAASRWGDKMRTLGYYDAYLGFLSEPGLEPKDTERVIDMGAGTAAFAEAWVAVNGAPQDLLLVDLSPQMLARGTALLARRGVDARIKVAALGYTLRKERADEVLAAHLLEHVQDPLGALCDIKAVLRPGGRLRLVFSKPHWCNAIIWMKWRHRTFGVDEMRRLVRTAGFEIECEYAFPAGPPSRTSYGLVARRPA